MRRPGLGLLNKLGEIIIDIVPVNNKQYYDFPITLINLIDRSVIAYTEAPELGVFHMLSPLFWKLLQLRQLSLYLPFYPRIQPLQ